MKKLLVLLLFVGTVVGLVFFWKYVLGVLVFWILVWAWARGRRGRESYRSGEVGDVHVCHRLDSAESKRPRVSSYSGLHVPRVNQKGVDFIVGRKRGRR